MTFEEFANHFIDFWGKFGQYVILVSTASIVLLVFGLLLGEKHEDKKRLYFSLFLIIVGSILTTVVSPFSAEWNALLIGAFFTPLIAYLIDFLKNQQEFSKQKDKLSYDYRHQQVEKESNIIGDILGELSTHAAAFKSYGIQKIESERWQNSSKIGLISDIHTLSVARYYYFVPMYNRVVDDLNDLIKENQEDKIRECLQGFEEVKRALLETEIAIFVTLIYDLGLLQHNYFARRAVEFPLHMGLLLEKRLIKFKIIKEDEKVDPIKVFSDANSKRFNKEMVSYLNTRYANIGLKLKAVEKKIKQIKK